MNEEMIKSLVDLIDDSMSEIEELRKSGRFSASEVSLGDSASGIESRDKNGSIGKKEDAEKAEDEDEDEDEDEKDEDKKDKKDDDKKDMDKADGTNSESDPNAGKHQAAKADDEMDKGEMMSGDSNKGSSTGGSAGNNRQADPNGGKHQPAYKSVSDDAEFKEALKKSTEETSALMKTYIDEKVGSLEAKLTSIADLVKEIANTPVPSKGSSYKNVTPLTKSQPETETLSKAEVADKLFELKKSGGKVDSMDIASVELGSPGELSRIVNKYNIK